MKKYSVFFVWCGLNCQFFTDQSLKTVKKKNDPLLGWHWRFPTVGLTLEDPFYPPIYPYIPHFFSLHTLAPLQGKGVTIVLLDTGVAAFDCYPFRKHPDLQYTAPINSYNCFLYGATIFERILVLVRSYVSAYKCIPQTIEQCLIDLIIQYLKTNNENCISEFIKKYGNHSSVHNGQLTNYGKAGAKKLLDEFAASSFDIYQQTVRQLVPLPGYTNHGTHMYGLIAATNSSSLGIYGIAPKATTIMLKVFNDAGCSDKKTLIAALNKAQSICADIVTLSLKIADRLDLTEQSSQQLEKILERFPYVVAASGNSKECTTIESYPARFLCIPCDVGAFGYDPITQSCTIPSFSQYESGFGPLFVAPGIDILSTAINPNTYMPGYLSMHGTSCATTIMSGFFALMVAEFNHDFSREQLLKVCYACAFKMHERSDWKTKTVCGVLDMRTVLFIVHVLKAVKIAMHYHTINFDVAEHFDHLVDAIRTLLFWFVEEYSTYFEHPVNFSGAFMDYYAAAKLCTVSADTFLLNYGIDIHSLESSILFFRNCILACIDESHFSAKVPVSLRPAIAIIKLRLYTQSHCSSQSIRIERCLNKTCTR